MISDHIQYTQSPLAKTLLSEWPHVEKYFVKVMPLDYKAALEKQKTESKEKNKSHG